MTKPPGPLASVAADAARAAVTAAELAGVTIRPLDGDELQPLVDLFAAVWQPEPGRDLVPLDLARALAGSGNYVVGAFADASLVGGSVGFFGGDPGHRHLHSHLTGVLPGLQHRALGYAIKLHQRAWALAAGLDEVIWTFDPLVRRNAYFNLTKLGARVVAYEERFYGSALTDQINAGDESDRAVVDWPVAAPEVASALGGQAPVPPAGGRVILEPSEGGTPVEHEHPAGGPVRAWVPPDIVAVRRSDPDLALAWRRALRHTLGRAVAAGYTAVAMDRDGWYTLVPANSTQ